jgi:pimeloyl-ACP methyl ester carboxylesterase
VSDDHGHAALEILDRAEAIEIEAGALRLAALAWGPRDGLPVLCLHGWLDNAASFAPLAEHLSHLRLIALELPGHGHSEHRPDGTYQPLDWVADVVRAADALELDDFAIIGHSMGAGIGSLVAGTIPGRVARLALIEGIGGGGVPDEELPERLRTFLEEERQARSFADRRRPAAFESAVRARMAARPIDRASVELLAARGVHWIEDGVLWRHDRALQRARPRTMSEGQVQAFLRAIDCPTLLVMANDGERWLGDVAKDRAGCIRNLREVAVEGQHHVHMDDPAVVAEPIRDFLK